MRPMSTKKKNWTGQGKLSIVLQITNGGPMRLYQKTFLDRAFRMIRKCGNELVSRFSVMPSLINRGHYNAAMSFRGVFSVATAAAAPVFFAGIAFAVSEDPVDEEIRRETIYSFSGTAAGDRDTYARYPDYEAGNNTLPAALFQYVGIVGMESGWTYDAAGYNNGDIPPFNGDLTRSDVPAYRSEAGSEPAEDVPEGSIPFRTSGVDGDELHAYDFSIPFDDSVTEEIGFTGRFDDDGRPVSFAANTAGSGDSRSSDKGMASSLFFDKNAFNIDSNRARIMSGNSRFGEFEDEKEFIGTPFSIPFALLCFALGLGIILVIHTATGKQSNH